MMRMVALLIFIDFTLKKNSADPNINDLAYSSKDLSPAFNIRDMSSIPWQYSSSLIISQANASRVSPIRSLISHTMTPASGR